MDLVGEAGENGQAAQSTLTQRFEMERAGQRKMSLEKATQIAGYSPQLYEGKK
jgi:hypothetical protein